MSVEVKMHYVKQLFEDDIDDWVHERFVRYGRGMFDGAYLSVKSTGKGLKLSGSWDYAGGLVDILSNSSGSVKLKGAVFAKRDLSDVLSDFFELSKEKKKKSLYSAVVSGEVDCDALKGLVSMVPDAYLLLTGWCGKNKIKAKNKLPKPGGKVKVNFCSASFDSSLTSFVFDEYLFDVEGEFEEATISHKYVVDEIVPPEGVTDPARIRIEAKRKGTIIRKLIVDGKESEKTIHLLV